MSGRRVALVHQAAGFVGPALARELAGSGHDLVLVEPRAGLVEELEAVGAAVEAVRPPASGEPRSLETAEGWQDLVQVTLNRFGRLDAASLSPGGGRLSGHRGPFLESKIESLQGMYPFFDSTFHALQAVIPSMQQNDKGGQILVFTSDAGARPEARWGLYGAIRAGQNFLVQAVALEFARDDICINAIGSKNAVAEGFPYAPPGAATDHHIELGEWAEPLLAETPLPRLGTMDELAAFAAVLLDGRNRFQTATYFSYSGGWNIGTVADELDARKDFRA